MIFPGVDYIKPKNVVEVEIGSLGVLENPVIADEPVDYKIY